MKAITLTNLALACALALAGCAKSPKTTAELVGGPMLEMRQAVERNVADPSRQTQLLALVGELDGVLQAHSRDLDALSNDLSRLNADYDATREAFDTLASAFAQRSQVRKERALDLHFQVEKAVKKQVADQSRRNAAGKVIGLWASDVNGFLEQSKDRQEALAKLMRRHDATRPEFTALLSSQASANDEVEQHVLDYRFALKQKLTREKWERVFAVEH